MGTSTPNDDHLIALRKVLDERFNKSELRNLCFDLKVDYEDLPGSNKADKARELVAYLERHNRVQHLLEMGKKLRPDVAWDDLAQLAQDASPILQDESVVDAGGVFHPPGTERYGGEPHDWDHSRKPSSKVSDELLDRRNGEGFLLAKLPSIVGGYHGLPWEKRLSILMLRNVSTTLRQLWLEYSVRI